MGKPCILHCGCLLFLACWEDKELSTQMLWVQMTSEVVQTSLGSGDRDRCLRFGLYNLCNPEVFEIESVGLIQLIDKREHYFLPLVYREARGIPNRGTVEGISDQGKSSHRCGYLACGQ